jgi:nucleoside-diphosphate-sugar epimerase
VRWIESDLGDPKPLLEPLAGHAFALVHLAWDTARTPRFAAHADHVRRLAGLLDAWPERGAGRLVALGSAEELGGAGGVLDEAAEALSPFSPYGWGKRAARALAHEWSGRSGAPAFWLRPFIVYGPGQRGDMVIPYAIERALSGGRGEFSAGYQRRDFVHVDDVVDAILRATESPLTGWNEFHIGSGTKVAVREVVGEIADQLEARDRFVFGARAIKPGEPEIQVADVRRARAVLGWVPRIGWREGVRALCAEARMAGAPPHPPQRAPHGGAGGR